MPDASGAAAPAPVLAAQAASNARARLAAGVAIARIDAMLGRQVDAIIHHPRFQRLEASWRGLAWLVDRECPGSRPPGSGDPRER